MSLPASEVQAARNRLTAAENAVASARQEKTQAVQDLEVAQNTLNQERQNGLTNDVAAANAAYTTNRTAFDGAEPAANPAKGTYTTAVTAREAAYNDLLADPTSAVKATVYENAVKTENAAFEQYLNASSQDAAAKDAYRASRSELLAVNSADVADKAFAKAKADPRTTPAELSAAEVKRDAAYARLDTVIREMSANELISEFNQAEQTASDRPTNNEVARREGYENVRNLRSVVKQANRLSKVLGREVAVSLNGSDDTIGLTGSFGLSGAEAAIAINSGVLGNGQTVREFKELLANNAFVKTSGGNIVSSLDDVSVQFGADA
ncbi:MAG: hypothetical protein KC649_08150, partial [Candidatus Omnitrophica bacterium]|nr:hypothetical protein [Candidatus Omnitrophota bacterium]